MAEQWAFPEVRPCYVCSSRDPCLDRASKKGIMVYRRGILNTFWRRGGEKGSGE
jgi:hypothetical protein